LCPSSFAGAAKLLLEVAQDRDPEFLKTVVTGDDMPPKPRSNIPMPKKKHDRFGAM
jgi:hypothetical protein